MRIVLVSLVLAALPSVALAEPKLVDPLPAQRVDFEAQRTRLWNVASPAVRAKVAAPIKQLLARPDVTPKANEPPLDLFAEAKKLATPIAVAPADIEALAMLILMQAAKQAQDDLKDLLAEMKAANDGKAEQREAIDKLKRTQRRVTAFNFVLSNMLKKLSDTQTAIIANLK